MEANQKFLSTVKNKKGHLRKDSCGYSMRGNRLSEVAKLPNTYDSISLYNPKWWDDGP